MGVVGFYRQSLYCVFMLITDCCKVFKEILFVKKSLNLSVFEKKNLYMHECLTNIYFMSKSCTHTSTEPARF